MDTRWLTRLREPWHGSVTESTSHSAQKSGAVLGTDPSVTTLMTRTIVTVTRQIHSVRSLFLPEPPSVPLRVFCLLTHGRPLFSLLPCPLPYTADLDDYADTIETTPSLDGRWFRLAGVGDGLPRTPSSDCGAYLSGWLHSQPPGEGQPGWNDEGTGAVLPTPEEGAKPYTACFGNEGGPICIVAVTVRVVNCGRFYLWQLPNTNACPSAFCAAPTDMPHANDATVLSVGTDCLGTYAPCTIACEDSADRVWMETMPVSGFGRPCPAAMDCQMGDGECQTCRGATLIDRVLGGCEQIAGFASPAFHGFCRGTNGRHVESRVLDGVTLDDCARYCLDSPLACSGIASDNGRCFVYGLGQADGLSDFSSLQPWWARVEEWMGNSQQATEVVAGSSEVGDYVCLAISTDGGH